MAKNKNKKQVIVKEVEVIKEVAKEDGLSRWSDLAFYAAVYCLILILYFEATPIFGLLSFFFLVLHLHLKPDTLAFLSRPIRDLIVGTVLKVVNFFIGMPERHRGNKERRAIQRQKLIVDCSGPAQTMEEKRAELEQEHEEEDEEEDEEVEQEKEEVKNE